MSVCNRWLGWALLGGVVLIGWGAASQVRPAPWVSLSATAYPDEDVAIQYTLVFTEPYLRLAEPQQAVRLLSIATCMKSGQVLLRSQGEVAGLSVTSSDPHTIVLGPVNLGVVETFAAQALGLPEIEPGDEESPRYELAVSPAGGKSWGDVTTRDDVVVTVSVQE